MSNLKNPLNIAVRLRVNDNFARLSYLFTENKVIL
jgi:hypothetical protein